MTLDAAPAAGPEAERDWPIRRLLLWVTLLGIVGLLLELVLLEHWESRTQWIPLAALVLGLVVALALLVRPTRGVVRLFRAISMAFVAAGLLGLWLHFDGNLAFEREDDPSATGVELVRRSVFGATPLLAPGALVQLGLIGLCITYRHPALRRGAVTAVRSGTITTSQETR